MKIAFFKSPALAFMGIILLITGLVGWMPATLADTASPHVLIRTRLNPETPIVGQQVEFNVDVFVDTWFAKAPQFPEIKVADAIALLPPTASINLSDPINGQTYAGQRRTYYLFPQLPGRYEIPAISITVMPAQPGQSSTEAVQLSTDPVSFMAQLPPELLGRSVVATPQFQVETAVQTADGTALPQTLHIGDTLQRTVTLKATDTLASALPALAAGDTPGLAAYPDPAQLRNQFNRGEFVATRRDRMVYVAEQPGHYRLPEQAFYWWNTSTQSLETELIPAIHIQVQPTLRQVLWRLLPGVLITIALVAMGWAYRRPLQSRWQAYRRHQADSESAAFRNLYQACQRNDPQVIWRQLSWWLERSAPETVTVEAFLTRIDDAQLTGQVTALEQYLFANPVGASPSGPELAQSLKRIRKSWRRQLRGTPPTLSSGLAADRLRQSHRV
jgi:hypothetical protein